MVCAQNSSSCGRNSSVISDQNKCPCTDFPRLSDCSACLAGPGCLWCTTGKGGCVTAANPEINCTSVSKCATSFEPWVKAMAITFAALILAVVLTLMAYYFVCRRKGSVVSGQPEVDDDNPLAHRRNTCEDRVRKEEAEKALLNPLAGPKGCLRTTYASINSDS